MNARTVPVTGGPTGTGFAIAGRVGRDGNAVALAARDAEHEHAGQRQLAEQAGVHAAELGRMRSDAARERRPAGPRPGAGGVPSRVADPG